ncbi:hypothetical protein [Corynebacterium doosanense]|uniref:hypothetical protein n=1 Tax=Corynebacterium doosanense TaxID=1121358 RepID=UPI0003A7EB16|nr:hypothetical protein [Corynebacterium doosanense]
MSTADWSAWAVSGATLGDASSDALAGGATAGLPGEVAAGAGSGATASVETVSSGTTGCPCSEHAASANADDASSVTPRTLSCELMR